MSKPNYAAGKQRSTLSFLPRLPVVLLTFQAAICPDLLRQQTSFHATGKALEDVGIGSIAHLAVATDTPGTCIHVHHQTHHAVAWLWATAPYNVNNVTPGHHLPRCHGLEMSPHQAHRGSSLTGLLGAHAGAHQSTAHCSLTGSAQVLCVFFDGSQRNVNTPHGMRCTSDRCFRSTCIASQQSGSRYQALCSCHKPKLRCERVQLCCFSG